MKKTRLVVLAAAFSVGIAGLHCGGGSSGEKSKEDLRWAATARPTGTLDSASELEIESALEGLLNSISGLPIPSRIAVPRPNFAALLQRLAALKAAGATRAQSTDFDPNALGDCVRLSNDQKSFSVDLKCLATRGSLPGSSGKVSMRCDGAFSYADFLGEDASIPTDFYCVINFDNVTYLESEGADPYTAEGNIYLFTDTTGLIWFGAGGTFNGQNVPETFIAGIDIAEEELEKLIITLQSGDIFVLSGFNCAPDFKSATSCSFSLADVSGETTCSLSETSAEDWDLTCGS